MSNRPLAPSYATPQWANVTISHPAGANPWNGQPTKVAPPSDIFTPEQPAAAEYHNYLFNAYGVSVLASKTYQLDLLNFLGQIPGLNWNHAATVGNTGHITSVVWDSVGARWIYLIDDGTTKKVYQGFAVASPFAPLLELGTSPVFTNPMQVATVSPTHISVIESSTTTAKLYTRSTGAWTNTTLPATITSKCNGIFWPTGTNGLHIVVGNNGGASEMYMLEPVAGGTSWTSYGGAGALAAANVGGSQFLFVVGPSNLFIFSADSTHTNENSYARSDVGTSIVEQSFGANVAASEFVQGAAYGAADGCFLVMVHTAAAGTKILKSTTGATGSWSVVWSSANFTPLSLAVLGTLWVAAVNVVGSDGRVMISTDAGVSWRLVDAWIGKETISPATDIDYRRGTVTAGGGRFALWHSKTIALSLASGLPAVST